VQTSPQGSCAASDIDHPFTPPAPGHTLLPICRMPQITPTGMDLYGASLADIALALSGRLDRNVIDRTGIAGTYDLHLVYGPGVGPPLGPPPSGDPSTPPPAATDPTDAFIAIQSSVEKFGLKLESSRGPGEFLIIEHAERPTEN
jgi:uncharacterized protein (TIGR03435 family)